MIEHLTRRELLRRTLGAAVLAPVISVLRVGTAWAAQSVDCPIYMFHQTGGAAVENTIRTNERAGRIPITIKELGEIILGEREIPERPPFCLTFDDGYLTQYQQAVPVLDRYEAAATFFVMGTAWQGDRVHPYMSSEQIQDLSQRGYEIGSHTVNHRSLVALRRVDPNGYWDEIAKSKEQLEVLIDDEVTSFAYPNGSYDQVTINDVASIYRAAVSEIPGRVQSDGVRYLLRRTRA